MGVKGEGRALLELVSWRSREIPVPGLEGAKRSLVSSQDEPGGARSWRSGESQDEGKDVQQGSKGS